MLESALQYAIGGISLTCQQLLMLLGPALLLAAIMHWLSSFARKRASRVFGHRLFVWFTAPGTVIHELGHALFCVLFRHRIVDMQLFKPDDNGTLGYVKHSYDRKSFYQRIGNFFIGTGPIWLGTVVIFALAVWLLSPNILQPLSGVTVSYHDFNSWAGFMALIDRTSEPMRQVLQHMLRSELLTDWKFYLFAYGVFCVGSHITLSRPDIAGAWQGFVTLIAVLLVLNWLTLWGGDFALQASQYVTRYSTLFCTMMTFVLALNGIIAAGILAVSLPGRR